MRISTSQMYQQNLNSILQKQTDTNRILEQLSSGKKVNTAGDDPVAAIGIDNLYQQNALVQQYLKNVDYSKNHLSMAESKLGSAETLVTSIREQMLRAVNGTLAPSERQMIADELRGSLDELLSIANTQDESGNYLFSGFSTDNQPFAFDASGNMVYSGDSGVRDALVAQGVAMGTNIPGDSAFMKVPNGLGDYGVNYLASQTGDFRVLSAKIDNPAAHVADTYTFNFTDNGAGGVDLEVLDSGGTAVANVANFDASNPVSFNGIEVKLDGTPAGGDSFTMEPDAEVPIFDTIQQAIDLLEDPNRVNTPEGKAELAQLLNNVDSGLNQLSVARGVAGNNLKSLESYSSNHTEEELVNKSALSLLEDLDYASAITEFQKQQLALNAVSNVFSRVGSVSLFDFI
ncbi:flagellar hook-associated protein FlgL [Shewanella algae]|jgi:flagellar hook-associated protein 3 FlgL|uniref:flagellar hook-associated protein FlgL n=1 Tax=Shewanella algae TaxID=38313 RepID=UPI000787242A|nr:flagellar hook-associated protein FlgL [Shewanella algae]MBO2564577.1 flagellar hook-associated protein FlgL [Shewanella algae]MBO2577342.1 flagellar hook-associated protein FlgL [Shewanella algae]MBO2581653.1 flagellar hook-associated protein FlgL [Shewanella algae]MBO2586028.1 flagellar hook-associated protein FlgL [Shewanella algae]MBO2590316.1 flagellar hook-associated protein FlgL [Shewanella algae]